MLNKSVRLVALQFSFSNPDAIPPSVKHRKPETPGEREERKNHTTGELIIPPTENCSVAEFLGELEAAGYELVDAFYKERIDPKDPRNQKFIEGINAGQIDADKRTPGRIYHMVRFLFARSEFVDNLFDGFRDVRATIYGDLAEMACAALWRVRAFSNPLYEGGEEVVGQSALSINLEVRKPLFQPSGLPVVMRRKDAAGNPIGEPLPIEPEHLLRLDGDEIRLDPFEHTA